MLRSKLWRDRRGVIAIMFALALLPLILIVSLAIDYSYAIEARAQLNLAADSAAMHAVRVASQALAGGSTVAQATSNGIAAGQQWFAAQAGNVTTASVPTSGVTVDLTYTPAPGAFTATVSYSGTVNLQLGLSGITPTSWGIGGNASAIVSNSFLEVLLMLDNSSSMQIGATYTDIKNMMQLTPCNAISAWYPANITAYYATGTKPSGDPYSFYQCSYVKTYDGTLKCPLSVSVPPFASSPLLPAALTWTSSGYAEIVGPTCPNLSYSGGKAHPIMGAPCAFACHADNSKPAGTGNDFYALARGTIGTPNAITLRFDVLKNATNQLLSTMESSAETGANLSVGIYAFNQALSQVYPTSGAEAGNDFGAAMAAVGSPPTKPNQPDTGIQPDTLIGDAVHSDTYLNATMAQLASEVKPSGDGTTAAAPRKVLFLITDGMEDSCSGGACSVATIETTKCQAFKDLGYAVYVVYTPYYPLMHIAYLLNGLIPLVEGTGPGTIVNTLQKCATDPTNFVEATDLPSMTAALNLFLNTALNGPGRVTK